MQGHEYVMFPVNRYHIKYLQDTKQEDFSLNQSVFLSNTRSCSSSKWYVAMPIWNVFWNMWIMKSIRIKQWRIFPVIFVSVNTKDKYLNICTFVNCFPFNSLVTLEELNN